MWRRGISEEDGIDTYVVEILGRGVQRERRHTWLLCKDSGHSANEGMRWKALRNMDSMWIPQVVLTLNTLELLGLRSVVLFIIFRNDNIFHKMFTNDNRKSHLSHVPGSNEFMRNVSMSTGMSACMISNSCRVHWLSGDMIDSECVGCILLWWLVDTWCFLEIKGWFHFSLTVFYYALALAFRGLLMNSNAPEISFSTEICLVYMYKEYGILCGQWAFPKYGLNSLKLSFSL